MARKRKNRTHLKGAAAAAPLLEGVPKSFVIKHGQVGSSLAQLVRDVRKVMEPNTASRLRERSRNKLKDYLTLAPALRVTHLLAFTLTPIAPSFRIVRLSAGPTLSFRVERYSLVKDILKASRRSRSIGMEYLSPPLLVLASFPAPGPDTPPHLTLLMKSFQTLFPPLSPKTITLSSARRVVLVSYNSERGTVDWRHYLITVKPYGVSKRVRKVLDGTKTGVLNLGREKDVADFVLGRAARDGTDGYESAVSSAVDEDGDAVSLAGDYVGRNNKKGQRRAVRLDEIGPRMELRLVKITEGVPGREGAVIYHEFVKKSKKEVAALKAEHVAKEKLRRERREQQEENVRRKKDAAQVAGDGAADEDEDKDGDDDDEGHEDMDDAGWDAEEEISDGSGEEGAEEEISDDGSGEEGSDADNDMGDSESESDVEEVRAPKKKARIKDNR